MNDFLIYTLKSAICLAVLFLPFRVLLGKETFFRLNRYLLLAVVVISAILPASEIRIPVKMEQVVNEETTPKSHTKTEYKEIAETNVAYDKAYTAPVTGAKTPKNDKPTSRNILETETDHAAMINSKIVLPVLSILYMTGVAIMLLIKIIGLI